MINRFIKLTSFLLGSMVLFACEIINPEEQIPAFIRIEKFQVEIDDPTTQGSTSESVSDAWVYVNNDFLGVYELPATFPVLQTGEVMVQIGAGIKTDGIGARRIKYPFYGYYKNDSILTLFPDSIITVSPEVKYESAQFAWLEDFENLGISIIKGTDSDVEINRTTNPEFVFEGNGSCMIQLNSSEPEFHTVTEGEFNLPFSGQYVYLEMDFNVDVPMWIGLRSNLNGVSKETNVLWLNATSGEWKKIYIDLTDDIELHGAADYYKIVFRGVLGDETQANMFMDNLKLIHP